MGKNGYVSERIKKELNTSKTIAVIHIQKNGVCVTYGEEWVWDRENK